MEYPLVHGKMRISLVAIIFVFHQSVEGQRPLECSQYLELNRRERHVDYPYFYGITDLALKPGWYRITGDAGDHLREGVIEPQFIDELGEERFFCGLPSRVGSITVLRNNSHPSVADGMVRRKLFIYFYDVNFTSPLSVFCRLVTDSHDVWIRNCGGYFVYYLRGFTGRYCTDGAKLVQDSSTLPWECESAGHRIFADADREWDFLPSSFANLRTDALTITSSLQSLRFKNGAADVKLVENCPSPSTASQRPCNTYYRGWVVGPHPRGKLAVVEREICFSPPGSCECVWSFVVVVRNCGGYFVYVLTKNSLRKDLVWRLCTQAITAVSPPAPPLPSQNNLCNNYKLVWDNTRLYDHVSPNTVSCEANYYRSVRFLSSRGASLKLKDGCIDSKDLFVFRGRCGGLNGETHLVGGHPSVQDGVVLRTVCRRLKFLDDQSSACGMCGKEFRSDATQEVVQVQNCGLFYVYGLEPILSCDSRYCLEEQEIFPTMVPTVTVTKNCPDLCPLKGLFTGLLPHPTDRSRFISCAHGITGGCLSCPSGLAFNPELEICDYSVRVRP